MKKLVAMVKGLFKSKRSKVYGNVNVVTRIPKAATGLWIE